MMASSKPLRSSMLRILFVLEVDLVKLSMNFRIERVKLRKMHGMAKVIGSVVALAGAIVYMYVKGPPMFSASHTQVSNPNAKSDSVKGFIIMLVSNVSFALYLVAQVRLFPLVSLFYLF